MIAFRPVPRADPSRPSPHQAARIPPLRPPQNTPDASATEIPQPMQRKHYHNLLAYRPALLPEADRSSLFGSWRRMLLASFTTTRSAMASARLARYPTRSRRLPPRLSILLRRAAIDPLPDDDRPARISSRRGCSGVANGRARRADKQRRSWGSPAAPASASSSVGTAGARRCPARRGLPLGVRFRYGTCHPGRRSGAGVLVNPVVGRGQKR